MTGRTLATRETRIHKPKSSSVEVMARERSIRHDPRDMDAITGVSSNTWRDAPAQGLDFPYMVWARTRSGAARFPLTQSGMPPADPKVLGAAPPVEIGHAAVVLGEVEHALARRFRVPVERVVATVGGSGGLQACAWTWFGPGSRVVVDNPSYEPFRALPRRLGADMRLLERRLEDGWQIDPTDLRRALGTGPGRGHVFLANPHNPSGMQLGRARMTELAREAERAGGLLVSCDLYGEYEPESERVDAFRCAPNVVSIGSLTKAYGLGALRIGWIVLGEGVAADVHRVRDATYLAWVDAPLSSLRLGLAALERLPELLAPYRALSTSVRPMWTKWLRETPGVRTFVPDHGIIAFPRIEGVTDTYALAEFLVKEHDVGVVPGEFFGLAGHVRVGCGLPAEQMSEALARLTRGLAAWRTRRA